MFRLAPTPTGPHADRRLRLSGDVGGPMGVCWAPTCDSSASMRDGRRATSSGLDRPRARDARNSSCPCRNEAPGVAMWQSRQPSVALPGVKMAGGNAEGGEGEVAQPRFPEAGFTAGTGPEGAEQRSSPLGEGPYAARPRTAGMHEMQMNGPDGRSSRGGRSA